MHIAFLVGNGLSLSFREHAGPTLDAWNPNAPLSWLIPTPGKETTELREHLPHFGKELCQLRKTMPGSSDFELLNALVRAAEIRRGAIWPNAPLLDEAVVEARHFVVNAFARFQQAACGVPSGEWAWTSWLKQHSRYLVGAVSFNYDLVLERALVAAGVKYHRFCQNDNLLRLPILKPHGSVDFDYTHVHAAAYDGGPPLAHEYPLPIYVEQPDVPAARMLITNICKPRLVSAVVLPAETSGYRELGWVKQGYAWWVANAPSVTHVVIVGLSYWPCDRPELQYLLEAIPRQAAAYVANPNPNPDMQAYLKSRFASVEEWRDTPCRL